MPSPTSRAPEPCPPAARPADESVLDAPTLCPPAPEAAPNATRRPHRARARRAAGALLAAATSVCLVAAGAPSPAVPQGLGDRLYPNLGNPGYDVQSYDISLAYPGTNTKPLRAVTRIDARATEDLDRVNLDFTHGRVESVEVNGAPAAFATAEEDLVVTPAAAVPRGGRLHITVRHTSDPVPGKGKEGGWVQTKDGLVMANQPDAAHTVFPCNDHPSDKARFTFHVTAPNALTVVAGGVPLSRTRHGAATTWVYRTAHPMATELAQVSIGRSAVVSQRGPHGLEVRHVLPAADRKTLEPWVKKTPDQIAWLESKVGRYPFETYGLVVADAKTGFELETQTLSLFEKRLFPKGKAAKYPAWYVQSVMVHELSHQWFGDSVSPRAWSDVWLNEAHATWYEALYAEKAGGIPLADRMHSAYLKSDEWRAEGGPPAAPKAPDPGGKISLFRPVIYDGAALALYALREEIGATAFERLERTWVRANRDGTAVTADFVRLASQLTGRDLDGFFHAWLYGKKTPPMPGHPRWRDEATKAAAATAEPARKPAQAATDGGTEHTAPTGEKANTAPSGKTANAG